jgi:GNAT superfamily N-acetyltransferase
VAHACRSRAIPARVGPRKDPPRRGGFSYRNTIVAETAGEIAASLVGYRLDDPYYFTGLDEVPEFVRPLVRLESQAPGSWYVNALATFFEFRGCGIRAKLLEVTESRGRKTGAPAMSVIVGRWHEGAMHLYEQGLHARSERAGRLAV